MMKRTSKGRRKIEIKKIEQLNSRQVTFSKRRNGLFNKAHELSILTGAEVAILVQSPGNRVFAAGNPNVDSVIGKYLGDGSNSNSPENNYPVNEVDANMNQELNKKFLEIRKELELEKSKSKINTENNIGGDLCWWEQSFENLGLDELEKYISSMEELMNNVTTRADEILLTSSILESNSNNVDGFDRQVLINSDHQLIPNSNQVVPNYVCGDELLMQDSSYGEDFEFFDDFVFTNDDFSFGPSQI